MTTLLSDLLTRSARTRAERPALFSATGSVSYRELAGAVDALGSRLASAGIGKGDRVAICLPKGPGAVVTIWAVLRTGAAYVPLDVASPPRRLQELLDLSRCRAAVTSIHRRIDAGSAISTLAVDPRTGTPEHGGLARSAVAASAPGEPDDAYVLFTSGSTGTPKGVVHTHTSALAFVQWSARYAALTSADRVLSVAPFHFDLSSFDLFAVAAAGASLILPDKGDLLFPGRMAAVAAATGATVLYATPTAFRVGLLDCEGADLSTIRLVLYAGEHFPTAALRRLVALVPAARVCNLYGPTETNVCTAHDVGERELDAAEGVSIGRAVAGDDVVVVGTDGVLPPGEIGEVWVTGPTVMRGYLNAAGRTEGAFAQLPGDPRRFYRTGDFASRAADGSLWLRGRSDDQVKRRGVRLELGEIEAVLARHEDVRNCAVVAVDDPVTGCRLTAYVESARPITRGELGRHCRAWLSAAALPDEFVWLAALPRTTSGKVDRRALLRRRANAGMVAP